MTTRYRTRVTIRYLLSLFMNILELFFVLI